MKKRSEDYDHGALSSNIELLLFDLLEVQEEILEETIGKKPRDDRPRPLPVLDLSKAPDDPIENQSWEWSPGRRVSWIGGKWRSDAEIRSMAEVSVIAFLSTAQEASSLEVVRGTGLSPANAQSALIRLDRQRQVIRVSGAYRLAASDDAGEVAVAVSEFEESLDTLGGTGDPSAPSMGDIGG